MLRPTSAAHAPARLRNASATPFMGLMAFMTLVALTAICVSTPAVAAPTTTRFEPTTQVQGTRLLLAENTSTDVMLHHTVSTTRLIEIFSGRHKLAAGDTFAMDFIPGKGTQFYIQGQAQGEPVGNAEFFNVVLGIWVGAAPADRALKQALLGREKDGQ